MNYKTQGFIKGINLNTGEFTIEPTAPHAFEQHTPIGAVIKHALFVHGAVDTSPVNAVIAPEGCWFKADEPMGCVATLINLRHAHDILEIEVGGKIADPSQPKKVASIKIIK